MPANLEGLIQFLWWALGLGLGGIAGIVLSIILNVRRLVSVTTTDNLALVSVGLIFGALILALFFGGAAVGAYSYPL